MTAQLRDVNVKLESGYDEQGRYYEIWGVDDDDDPYREGYPECPGE